MFLITSGVIAFFLGLLRGLLYYYSLEGVWSALRVTVIITGYFMAEALLALHSLRAFALWLAEALFALQFKGFDFYFLCLRHLSSHIISKHIHTCRTLPFLRRSSLLVMG